MDVGESLVELANGSCTAAFHDWCAAPCRADREREAYDKVLRKLPGVRACFDKSQAKGGEASSCARHEDCALRDFCTTAKKCKPRGLCSRGVVADVWESIRVRTKTLVPGNGRP